MERDVLPYSIRALIEAEASLQFIGEQRILFYKLMADIDRITETTVTAVRCGTMGDIGSVAYVKRAIALWLAEAHEVL